MSDSNSHTIPPDVLPEEIVTTSTGLTACCEHLAACRRFGFDTEFVGENTYHPHLCLVQVATDEKLYLIDPLAIGPIDDFWKLVVDPANQVVVHAGREEVRLCRVWTGKRPGNLFDLQIAAGLVGLAYPLSHGSLVNQVVGVQLTKGETLTEWRDRPLTRAQIRYAFDDVRYLLPAWRQVSQSLERLGRSEWASEEFDRLAGTVTMEEGPAEKWRKLRGLGSLDRRRLAMVRALYQWREETAERLNRPARTIVRDDLIVEIVRRNPTRERDLHPIRGLPKRDLPAIIETLEAARGLAIESCPAMAEREQDPAQAGLVANLLQAVLGDHCAKSALASNLVATSQDVKLLVRSRMQGTALPTDSLLTQGWRAQHILPELLAVLEGKRTLRIGNIRSDSPFVLSNVVNPLTP